MMRRSLLLGLLLASLAACGTDPRLGQYVGDYVTATSFEALEGWGGDEVALTHAQAHSGRVAIFVGPARERSLTYRLPLRLASVHALKAVEVDAWVLVPSAAAADAALVVQVLPAPGAAPLADEQLLLRGQVHSYGSWQHLHHVFVLPPSPPWSSELRLFLQRGPSPEPVYLDDLTVKARE